MVATAALAPIRDRIAVQRDRLSALIDRAPSDLRVPQWMIDEGCSILDFGDDFDNSDMIDPIRYPIDGVGPQVPTDSNWYMPVYPTQLTDYAVANSILTIRNDSSSGAGGTLVTCPHGYPDKGRTFKGTCCYEVRVRWDSSASKDNFPNAGGVFWSNSIKLMRWWMENIRTGRNFPDLFCCDLNFLESPKMGGKQRILCSMGDYYHGGRPGAPTIEDWAAHFSMIERPDRSWADDYINDYIPNFQTRDWHDYGQKHTIASDGGGIGSRKVFIDGHHIEQMDITWKPGDMFSGLDDDARYLILGTGLSNVAEYDRVIVGKKRPSGAMPPPPSETTSPEGAIVSAPAGSIVDLGGRVWTFGGLLTGSAHNPGPDYAILKDGRPLPYGGGAKSISISGGVIFAHTDNRWGPLVYKDTGTGWVLVSGTQ